MFRFITINEDERGLLIRDGKFRRILEPGRHRFFDLTMRRKVLRFQIKDAEFDSDWATVIEKNHPDIASRLFETVSVGEGEVAIVSFDGRPTHLVGPWKLRYFWKVLTDVSTEFIDVKNTVEVDRRHLNSIDTNSTQLVTEDTVNQFEAGLLFVDGELTARLAPGRHAFWQVHRKVLVQKMDLRPLPIEITAQEILTRDRITLRVTLTAFSQVKDPEKSVQATGDYQTYIYRLVQFAVREAISNRTLDEVLNNRETVDNQVRSYVREHMDDIGVEVTELGLKDIILPGDMRELINKVVEAEKVAQANLIQRREETAATRALLNTARLMENNPLLMRLKELEALEKLTTKVGRININTGSNGNGFDALLTNLLQIEERGDGQE